ncbi:MAG: hypothetical protein ACLTEH_02630 [Clostridia bacterium]
MQKQPDNNAWYRYLSKHGPNYAKDASPSNPIEQEYFAIQQRNIAYCKKRQEELKSC